MNIVYFPPAINANNEDTSVPHFEDGAIESPIWSFSGETNGCRINPVTGEVTAGALPAKVCVVASDSADKSFVVEAFVFVVRVQIGHVSRDAALPDSMSPNGLHVVDVTVEPPLHETDSFISFDVDNGPIERGRATIESSQQLATSGRIRVRADMSGGRQCQTVPGHAGKLHVRAFLNGGGAPIAHSPGFSLCAHPHEVLNQDPRWLRTDTVCGMEVGITVNDDGPRGREYLDAVLGTELLTQNVLEAGIDPGIAKSRAYWQTCREAQKDFHGITREKIVEIAERNAVTTWYTEQLDVFLCTRCGMASPAVIPHSGYRITRTVRKLTDGVVELYVEKRPVQCLVDGFEAAPGPSATIAMAGRIHP